LCPHPGTRPRHPKPDAPSRPQDPAARTPENLKLNYRREKITLSASLVNNPGSVSPSVINIQLKIDHR
jgi:hypothetical protein